MKTNKSSFPGLVIITVVFFGILTYSVFIKHNLIIKRTGQYISADSNPVRLSEDVKQDRAALPPLTCSDPGKGIPVIVSLSKTSGSVGDELEIRGCNFSGFEGDKTVWIENESGVKGILHGESGSTSEYIRLVLKSPLCSEDTSYSGLPCKQYLTLVPGSYEVYVKPWGNKSNAVDFVIE